MDSKGLKASWIIVLIVNCIAVIIGLTIMIAPEVFMISEYEGYTGKNWADFISSNPDAAAFLRLESTQMGWYLFTLGVVGIIITILLYKKGNKQSWYILLVLIIMGVGGSLGYDLPTGIPQLIMMVALFLVIGLIGLAIGAKPILKGSSA